MDKLKYILILSLFVSIAFASPLSQKAEFYNKHFNTENIITIKNNKIISVQEKLTNGSGVPLYTKNLTGTRRFRVVLSGVLYRSGAEDPSTSTSQDRLTPATLKNLCKEGFSNILFAYNSPYVNNETYKCNDFILSYKYHNWINYTYYLDLIYKAIKNPETSGLILTHCWHGLHASGYASTVALIQFCDFTPSQAISYWETAAEFSGAGEEFYENVLSRIKQFIPIETLKITLEEKEIICPKISSMYQ